MRQPCPLCGAPAAVERFELVGEAGRVLVTQIRCSTNKGNRRKLLLNPGMPSGCPIQRTEEPIDTMPKFTDELIQRIRSVSKSHKITITEMGRRLGKSDNFISSAFSQGASPETTAALVAVLDEIEAESAQVFQQSAALAAATPFGVEDRPVDLTEATWPDKPGCPIQAARQSVSPHNDPSPPPPSPAPVATSMEEITKNTWARLVSSGEIKPVDQADECTAVDSAPKVEYSSLAEAAVKVLRGFTPAQRQTLLDLVAFDEESDRRLQEREQMLQRAEQL